MAYILAAAFLALATYLITPAQVRRTPTNRRRTLKPWAHASFYLLAGMAAAIVVGLAGSLGGTK